MKIYLVKNGETEKESLDSPLTEDGFNQINLLARRLRHEQKINVARIYSSSQLSSKQTAEILSKSLYLPIFHDERIIGIDQNIFLQNKNFDESLHNLNELINFILQKNEDVIIAMDKWVNFAIISFLTKIPLNNMLNFSMAHSNITLIESLEQNNQKIWQIKFLNDIVHLKFA